MARHAAEAFARQGFDVALGARDAVENERLARDIEVRCGVKAVPVPFEAENFDSHETFLHQCETLSEAVPPASSTLQATWRTSARRNATSRWRTG